MARIPKATLAAIRALATHCARSTTPLPATRASVARAACPWCRRVMSVSRSGRVSTRRPAFVPTPRVLTDAQEHAIHAAVRRGLTGEK